MFGDYIFILLFSFQINIIFTRRVAKQELKRWIALYSINCGCGDLVLLPTLFFFLLKENKTSPGSQQRYVFAILSVFFLYAQKTLYPICTTLPDCLAKDFSMGSCFHCTYSDQQHTGDTFVRRIASSTRALFANRYSNDQILTREHQRDYF